MDNFHRQNLDNVAYESHLQYHEVLAYLTKASSQNGADLINNAERQLRNWETKRGFYTHLLTVACDKSVDVNIRWLSVLYIKNGIEKHWRKGTLWALDNAEKVFIKQKLLSCFAEPMSQIALQFAVIIAKLSRHDFPKEWPELFPVLLSGIQSDNELHQHRSLLVLNYVVKAQASKRICTDRRTFHQLAISIFPTVYQLWINCSKLYLEEISRDSVKLKDVLERSLLSLKILKKLVVNSKDIAKETEASNFLTLIFQQIGPFLECRSFLKSRNHPLDSCEKYLVLLTKILSDVLDREPFAFVPFIRPTLECSITFCFNKEFEGRLFEKLIVQFMNLIKAVLLCREYKPEKVREDTKNPLTFDADLIKKEFFTAPVLREICEQLLTRYLLLSETDLSTWENNPEEYVSEEGGESWKFNLRPCTETFFTTLLHEFQSLLAPLILEITRNMESICSTDLLGILKRDAIYNAVGLAAFDLYDEIDFDNWFKTSLISDLKVKQPGYHIVRRRVIWLVGQWVSVKMSPELRPILYEAALSLMHAGEDVVVRLAAASAVKDAVDDFEFSTDHLLPYLENMTSSLFLLLKDVKECDLKMQVLHVLSFIIERMGPDVRPYVQALMFYLPQLWESCGDHNMLRCSIISCYVQLVRVLGNLSESLHPCVLPMIALSTNVELPPHVYLLEDGLDLWWAVLDNASKCGPELMDIAANVIPLLEYKSNILATCLQIVEAYIIIAPEEFLRRYGVILSKKLQYAITDLKTDAISLVLKVVETAFIIYPKDGPVLFEPMLPFVIDLIISNSSLLIPMSVFVSVLSRVILHNQVVFGNALQCAANEANKEAEAVLGEILDICTDKFMYFNPVMRRKLLALALTCLLTSNSDVVHDRICGIFYCVIAVLNDVTKNESDPSSDLLVMVSTEEDENPDQDIETEHGTRKRKLSRLDPVYTVVLRDYLYNQVLALKQSVGETKFQELMSTVDSDTMQQLEVFLKN